MQKFTKHYCTMSDVIVSTPMYEQEDCAGILNKFKNKLIQIRTNILLVADTENYIIINDESNVFAVLFMPLSFPHVYLHQITEDSIKQYTFQYLQDVNLHQVYDYDTWKQIEYVIKEDPSSNLSGDPIFMDKILALSRTRYVVKLRLPSHGM